MEKIINLDIDLTPYLKVTKIEKTERDVEMTKKFFKTYHPRRTGEKKTVILKIPDTEECVTCREGDKVYYRELISLELKGPYEILAMEPRKLEGCYISRTACLTPVNWRRIYPEKYVEEKIINRT